MSFPSTFSWSLFPSESSRQSKQLSSGFDLYKAIIKPLRDADTTQLLKRFLVGPQAQHNLSEATILSLPDQLIADKVRPELLQQLMPIVGFTSELRNITDRLTTTQLRRLVTVAVPLWNQRHTRTGLINAIRLLTGRNALVSDWFTFRSILGEVSLTDDQLVSGGDFWIIGGEISTYDEFISNIRVMDDGTLDELLLLDVCKLMRPLDERFEVFIDDFLDHFDGTLDKWTNLSGGAITANGAIVPGNDPYLNLIGDLSPIIPILTPSIKHDYNIVFKFKLDTGGFCKIRWYLDSSLDQYYELRLDATSGLGRLVRKVGGVTTILSDFPAWPLSCQFVVGVWYSIRISTTNVDANTRAIRVLLDGNQAIPGTGTELIDAGGTDPSKGDIQFIKTSGVVNLDNVEIWRNPARFATIGISTVTERGGAVTMTSNFIQ